jgi:hypothetical protein
MKLDRRRVAALVLATALSIPVSAAAPGKQSGRGRTVPDGFARVIKQVTKFVRGLAPTTGHPIPPIPAPPPPPEDEE